MTTTTLPRLVTAPALAQRLLCLLGDAFEGIMEGRAIARRYDLLVRMSDSDLAHLGLTRQDIPRAAVNGVAGL